MQVKIDATGEILQIVLTENGSVELSLEGEVLVEMSRGEADQCAQALYALGRNEDRRQQVSRAAGLSGVVKGPDGPGGSIEE